MCLVSHTILTFKVATNCAPAAGVSCCGTSQSRWLIHRSSGQKSLQTRASLSLRCSNSHPILTRRSFHERSAGERPRAELVCRIHRCAAERIAAGDGTTRVTLLAENKKTTNDALNAPGGDAFQGTIAAVPDIWRPSDLVSGVVGSASCSWKGRISQGRGCTLTLAVLDATNGGRLPGVLLLLVSIAHSTGNRSLRHWALHGARLPCTLRTGFRRLGPASVAAAVRQTASSDVPSF